MINKIHFDKIIGKKVLVTGGLGFVGHNLVKELVQKYKCDVTIVDNEINSAAAILSDISAAVTILKVSILDIEYKGFLETFDYIFHLACIQIAHSSKDPLLDLQTNAISTLNMLEYLRHSPSSKLQRFVYTSSASVYGNAQNGLCNEKGPTKVLSHYAATKLLGENYTSIYFKQYTIPTTSVRYSNVFGYGQSPKNTYCGVIGKFIDNAFQDKNLFVFGDGQQTRDYTFISDAVDATILAAVHPNALGEVMNVGTGVETSVNKLAEIIIAASKAPLAVEHIPPRDIDNIRRRFTDISLIQDKLNWEPAITIEEGLKKTMDWYISNSIV